LSEPRACAASIATLAPDRRHWCVADERIGGVRSEAYAVRDGPAALWVLIDPLPLTADALEALCPVQAIVLTSAAHQRACWRLRRELGAPVHAPAGSAGLDEQPDHDFTDGAVLPGGLIARSAPGPRPPHFVLEHGSGPATAVFVGDLVVGVAGGGLALLPTEHLADLAAARASVRALAARAPELVGPGHGPPVTANAGAVLAHALSNHADA